MHSGSTKRKKKEKKKKKKEEEEEEEEPWDKCNVNCACLSARHGRSCWKSSAS